MSLLIFVFCDEEKGTLPSESRNIPGRVYLEVFGFGDHPGSMPSFCYNLRNSRKCAKWRRAIRSDIATESMVSCNECRTTASFAPSHCGPAGSSTGADEPRQ